MFRVLCRVNIAFSGIRWGQIYLTVSDVQKYKRNRAQYTSPKGIQIQALGTNSIQTYDETQTIYDGTTEGQELDRLCTMQSSTQ